MGVLISLCAVPRDRDHTPSAPQVAGFFAELKASGMLDRSAEATVRDYEQRQEPYAIVQRNRTTGEAYERTVPSVTAIVEVVPQAMPAHANYDVAVAFEASVAGAPVLSLCSCEDASPLAPSFAVGFLIACCVRPIALSLASCSYGAPADPPRADAPPFAAARFWVEIVLPNGVYPEVATPADALECLAEPVRNAVRGLLGEGFGCFATGMD